MPNFESRQAFRLVILFGMRRIGVWLQHLTTFAGSIWGPLLLTSVLGLPRLRFPMGDDAAIISNAAQTILNGGTLYRDIWFNHGLPLNPLLFAAFGKVAGLSAATPHVIHLLESLAGVALVYSAGNLALGRKHGLFGAYIFGLVSMLFVPFDYVAEPEFLAGLLGAVATVFLLTCLNRQQAGRESRCGMLILGAGFASGIAIAAKPVALPLVAAGLIWIWIFSKPFGLRYISYYAIGAAIVPFALLAWIAASGAIADMFDQVIAFNRYYSHNPGSLYATIVARINEALLLGLVLPLAVIGAVLVVRRWNNKVLWLLLWSGAGVAAAVGQGKPWAYHWFFALPALSLLAAYAVINAKEVTQSRPLLWLAAALIAASAISVKVSPISVKAIVDNTSKDVAAIVSLLPGSPDASGYLTRFEYKGGTMADVKEVTSHLTSHTEESDPIFVWMYTNAYIMAQRRPASKHAYLLPLIYGSDELLQETHGELMSDLRKNRPPYIVLPVSRGGYWKMVNVSFLTDPFSELLEFVSNNYALEAVVAKSEIYRLR